MPEIFKEYKVYGPYRGKDDRDRVILVKEGKKQTMSYPKFLWWKEKGELIDYNEHIHHKDENTTNNKLDNFKKISWHDHRKEHANPPEYVKCKWCDRDIVLVGGSLSNRRSNAKRGKEGPFCSRQCRGRYGAYVMYTVKKVKNTGGRKPYRLKNLALKLYKMRSGAE